MKKGRVKIGELYAVNNRPEGQLYTLAEVDGFQCRLEYLSSMDEILTGGWVDVSCLSNPTKDQLKVLDREKVAGMSDTEKALLNDCPFCGQSFAFAWSEVDADGFCRVTCGGCDETIEYKVDMVNCDERGES